MYSSRFSLLALVIPHYPSFQIDVIGSSLVGVPGIIIGRNQHMGWGVTTVGTDVQDVFLIDEVDEKGYNHMGSYLPYTIINEVIPLANGSNVSVFLCCLPFWADLLVVPR